MTTITLAVPWTYRTIAVTIDYTAGAHEVTDAVHDAAVLAGVHVHAEQENIDGHRNSAPRAPHAPRPAKR